MLAWGSRCCRRASARHARVRGIRARSLLPADRRPLRGLVAHPQPFYYYLPIVLFNWLPLSLAYSARVPRWWRDLQAGEARILLPLGWTLLIIVFFSIPVGKRDVYLMPALPMVALAMAPYLEEMVRDALAAHHARSRSRCSAASRSSSPARGRCSAIRAAAERFIAQRELEDLGHMVWGMVIAIGVAFVLARRWFRPRRGVHALLAGFAAMWLIWSFWLVSAAQRFELGGGRHARCARARRRRHRDRPGRVEGAEPADGRPVRCAISASSLRWDQQLIEAMRWQADRSGAAPRSSSSTRRWADCIDREKATTVGHANRREWWLVPSRCGHRRIACPIRASTRNRKSRTHRIRSARSIRDGHETLQLRQHALVQSAWCGSD